MVSGGRASSYPPCAPRVLVTRFGFAQADDELLEVGAREVFLGCDLGE